MEDPKTKETNVGVKAEGTWDEICDFFRKFESLVKDHLDEDSVERLDKWRPRECESRKDMKKKTAEEACIRKRKVEEEVEEDCGSDKEEFKEGVKEIAKSVKEIGNGKKAKEDFANGAKKVSKSVESKSIEEARSVEKKIYENVMLKMNPYYFDSEDVSVNFKKGKSGDYVIRVNTTNEELRKDLKRNLVEDGE